MWVFGHEWRLCGLSYLLVRASRNLNASRLFRVVAIFWAWVGSIVVAAIKLLGSSANAALGVTNVLKNHGIKTRNPNCTTSIKMTGETTYSI